MKLSTLYTYCVLATTVSQALLTFSEDDALIYAADKPFTLSSDGLVPDILILDFGQSFEGHPTFEVVATSGDTSCFEVSYAESAASLSRYEVWLRTCRFL